MGTDEEKGSGNLRARRLLCLKTPTLTGTSQNWSTRRLIRARRVRRIGAFRAEPWKLLSGDRSRSVARDARPDVAVRCRDAAEPAESFAGQTTKTAESTTFTVLGLKAWLIRRSGHAQEAWPGFHSDRWTAEGIRLQAKKNPESSSSAKEHAAELKFLKQLRGKTALLHILPLEEWMAVRTHRNLL